MDEILDVIIVGAGSAGLAALREVEKRTSNFAVINDGAWGTVCARVGCMPSKTLIERQQMLFIVVPPSMNSVSGAANTLRSIFPPRCAVYGGCGTALLP